MEKVASTVLFPCKFATSGCQYTMLHTEKSDHEEACEFRPYSCPCPGASCKWQGSLEQVMPHLLSQHRSITTLQGICFCYYHNFIHIELFIPIDRWRYSIFSNWHSIAWSSWLGNDAILLWSSLYARPRKAREIWRSSTVFCHRSAYRHPKASR